MRYVMTSDMVAHTWAHPRSDSDHANSDNLSFTGGFALATLRSYGTDIARIVTNHQGERCALISQRTYSHTTARHLSMAHSATSHLTRFFIPQVDGYCGPEDYRKSRLDEFTRKAREIPMHRLAKSRARAQEELEYRYAQLSEFCAFFGLRKPPACPNMLDPETAANAQKQAASEARKRAKEQEKQRIEREEWARKDAIEREINLEAWRLGSGLIRRLPDGDYLRLSSDGETVQTSRGADVPVSHVRRFGPMLLRAIRDGVSRTFGPDTPIRLGQFKVDAIDDGGRLWIGCHRIAPNEIERLVCQLGIVPAEEPALQTV